jgi:hemerythrin-like metal-binding protein
MSTVPVTIIEWTAELTVHVPEIDREHRIWFATVNRLHQAMLAGKGKDVLKPLLAEAGQYTLVHFAHEEKLMAGAHYLGIREHVEQHDVLRKKVAGFAARFARGETTLTIELTLFLSAWLKDHIMTTDIRLGEHLGAIGRVVNRGPDAGGR